MFDSTALARAEKTNFSMFDMEGFVGELAVVDRVAAASNATQLQVHASNDSVDLSVLIANRGLVSLLRTVAKCNEICTSLRRNPVEQLKYNLLLTPLFIGVLVAESHAGVGALFRSVDCLSVLIRGSFVVGVEAVLLREVEVEEGPFREVIGVTDVVLSVQVDEGVGLVVVVENAFHFVGDFLEEQDPLGLKELENFNRDGLRVRLV